MKADRFYENFAYSKAVEVYEKAIDLKQRDEDIFDMESALKIADSYRLMNNPTSAEKWYAKVEDTELMTDQDKMNYAQILLKNGKDNKAKSIIDSMENAESTDLERLRTIDDVGSYYADSAAYFVENMNINSEQADFSPTYYDNGFVFVSNRKNKRSNQTTYYWDDTYFLDLYYTEVSDGQNMEPAVMSKRINTIFHEGPATFSEDGNSVIFTRNNFNLGEERTSVEGVNMLKLYGAAKNKKGKWSKPVALPFNSDDYSAGHPALTNNGKTLYFSSDMEGSYGNADIYITNLIDGEWTTPKNMGPEINTSEDELFPYISDDNILYFASAGHPGIGGLDIYKVDLKDKVTGVTNLGYPVNTKADDFGLIMEGNIGYLSSDRKGGAGSDDIYKVNLFMYDLTANLVDAESGDLISGTLTVLDKSTNEIVGEIENGSSTSFSSVRGRELMLTGSSNGYLEGEMLFSTLEIPVGMMSYSVDLALEKPNLKGDILLVKNNGIIDQVFGIQEELALYDGSFEELKSDFSESNVDLEDVFEINSVLYDFDKSNIRDDAARELDKLINVLNTHADLKVTLSSHTDSRGSSSYNNRLAKKRAESAREYLLANGVDSERIGLEHFGEDKLLEDCNSENTCERVHQSNRRTEITLSR